MPITNSIQIEQWPTAKLKHFSRNSRKHPASQLKKVMRSIERFGFTNPILSDPDGEIIAGHARHKAATQLELKTVPVIVLKGLSDSEKRAYVIADNKLAEDAQWDEDLLKAEIDDLQLMGEIDIDLTGFDIGEIGKLDPTLLDDGSERMQKETEQGHEFEGIVVPTLVDNPIFPSSNFWGFPDLREDMLAEAAPNNPWHRMDPTEHPPEDVYLTWGEHRRERCQPEHTKGATLCFYEEDEAFERIWTEPIPTVSRMLEYGWGQVVCPDFSAYRDSPLIMRQYQYYRSMWMGRYFQEAGFKVIPSLFNLDERDYDWMLAGVPQNPPIVACQVLTVYNKFTKQEGHEERSCFHKAIKKVVEELNPGTICIYGGEPHEEKMRPHLPDGPNYIFWQSISALHATKKGNKAWSVARSVR